MTRRYDRAQRSEIQRRVQADLARREGRLARRGLLAAELVRDWPPDQRARIKADPLTPAELVKLIDQINEEERWQ